MLTQTLIDVAILVYFSVSSGHGIDFDLHAGTKATAKVEEKVVLRETTMSEKCELDVESIVRPDKEIAALQASASRFKSTIDLRALATGMTWETPELHTIPINWNDQFAVSWDDDGGFRFGGKYHPVPETHISPTFMCDFFAGHNH